MAFFPSLQTFYAKTDQHIATPHPNNDKRDKPLPELSRRAIIFPNYTVINVQNEAHQVTIQHILAMQDAEMHILHANHHHLRRPLLQNHPYNNHFQIGTTSIVNPSDDTFSSSSRVTIMQRRKDTKKISNKQIMHSIKCNKCTKIAFYRLQ